MPQTFIRRPTVNRVGRTTMEVASIKPGGATTVSYKPGIKHRQTIFVSASRSNPTFRESGPAIVVANLDAAESAVHIMATGN